MSGNIISQRAESQVGSARTLRPVTPSDAADLPEGPTRALYVGGAGVISVRDLSGNTVSIVSAGGQYHPIRIIRVLAAATTATDIVALY